MTSSFGCVRTVSLALSHALTLSPSLAESPFTNLCVCKCCLVSSWTLPALVTRVLSFILLDPLVLHVVAHTDFGHFLAHLTLQLWNGNTAIDGRALTD